jgi:GNAT superfamily N-acetyltransferase
MRFAELHSNSAAIMISLRTIDVYRCVSHRHRSAPKILSALPVKIRFATSQDLELLVDHRRSMFRDMGSAEEAELRSMGERYREWVLPRLMDDEYVAWVAENSEGRIVAGAGVWLMDRSPATPPKFMSRALVMNVYTDPAYRRQGLATRLMETALAYCREAGIEDVVLHASDEGRPMYESMGFVPTNEMHVVL